MLKGFSDGIDAGSAEGVSVIERPSIGAGAALEPFEALESFLYEEEVAAEKRAVASVRANKSTKAPTTFSQCSGVNLWTF